MGTVKRTKEERMLDRLINISYDLGSKMIDLREEKLAIDIAVDMLCPIIKQRKKKLRDIEKGVTSE